MKSPKNIMIPIDMSVLSITALQYAEEIAELFGASITVLHVAEDDEARKRPKGADADKIVKSAVAHLLLDHNVVTQSIAIEIRHGNPAAEIIKAAHDLHIDLIIMCTHGRSGLSHILMGSVAEKVVRLAVCPVLTIKPDEFRELINVTENDVTQGLHLE